MQTRRCIIVTIERIREEGRDVAVKANLDDDTFVTIAWDGGWKAANPRVGDPFIKRPEGSYESGLPAG